MPCFNIINAFKAAYLISGSILIILNDGVFEMDLNNPVLTGKKLRGAKKRGGFQIKVFQRKRKRKIQNGSGLKLVNLRKSKSLRIY